ncbi:MFS general substrate transporter [Hysterangium stoloniferum]|nr:MFS general substrate transporter [Hysterangium stoloniferum]
MDDGKLGDLAFASTENQGVDIIYEMKSNLVNQCLQDEIGWGRYQTELFIVSGFGWAADSLWLQGVFAVLPQIVLEMNPPHIAFAATAVLLGMLAGALIWVTLFIAGVFGVAAGGASNWVTFTAMGACIGFGTGGNLPVDGALFLEHIPQKYQWTLTLLSVFWAVGQSVTSLISWVFITNFSCPDSTPPGTCPRSENNGWRYTFFTLGGITWVMFIIRFFVFDLQESSKYLLAKGRDEEALAVLQHIARRNGRTITLTLDQLLAVSGGQPSTQLTPSESLKRACTGSPFSHVKPLFATSRLAINTSITILLWGLVGLAYPLFNALLPIYLNSDSLASGGGVNQTYRNYAIIYSLGIPGSLIACVLVNRTRGGRWSFGGRKFAMMVFTALTGIFLFLFATARTSSAILAYSCVTSLTQNAVYGIKSSRPPIEAQQMHCALLSTGESLLISKLVCRACKVHQLTDVPVTRVAGLMSPIIATYTNLNSPVPIFIAASLYLAAAVLALLLPIETAGKAAL